MISTTLLVVEHAAAAVAAGAALYALVRLAIAEVSTW